MTFRTSRLWPLRKWPVFQPLTSSLLRSHMLYLSLSLPCLSLTVNRSFRFTPFFPLPMLLVLPRHPLYFMIPYAPLIHTFIFTRCLSVSTSPYVDLSQFSDAPSPLLYPLYLCYSLSFSFLLGLCVIVNHLVLLLSFSFSEFMPDGGYPHNAYIIGIQSMAVLLSGDYYRSFG